MKIQRDPRFIPQPGQTKKTHYKSGYVTFWKAVVVHFLHDLTFTFSVVHKIETIFEKMKLGSSLFLSAGWNIFWCLNETIGIYYSNSNL